MKKLLKQLFPDTHPVRLIAHRWKSWLMALRYGFPAKNLTVICITGTDGKTTTVSLLAHILDAAGKKNGAVSTAFLQINGDRKPNPTQKTSLDAARLQKFLRKLVTEGCEYAVVEASSHGLMQGRLMGIRPTVAAITNVSMEHLDYHGTMDEYIAAKGMLFRALKGKGTKILNADDRTLEAYLSIASEFTTEYSPKRQISDVKDTGASLTGIFSIDGKKFPVVLPLHGAFNLENALCAVSCAMALGIPAADAVASLATFQGAGGRMERVDMGQPFNVFLDFTVTPAAYEKTLAAARTLTNNRLLVLTGSCGDRMKEKRPLVGKLCADLADVVVVSNEDPYTEDPEKIIDDVLSGIPGSVKLYRSASEAMNASGKYCVRISDRRDAIMFILKEARPGDTVLLCGKGADVTMMVGTTQIPWIERDIVKDELTKLGSTKYAV